MNKFNKNLYGASLVALAFSLNMAEASAQTCTVPPSCSTLGFTKTAADCDGKTILKCPFDQNAVYCPGYEEGSKTYGIGDTYTVNGVAVGKVISVTDCGNGGGGTALYNNPWECLGTSAADYIINSDSFGNRIFTSPNSSITCTEGRVYNSNGTSRTGIFRINGSSGGGCTHGTISSPVVRTGTRSDAMEKCAQMNAGGLSWYLPSTYNGYFFGYVTSTSAQPYMNGLWAVANGCFYNGSFYAVGDSLYKSRCQICTYDYSTNNETCVDKEMSYYCIAMF